MHVLSLTPDFWVTLYTKCNIIKHLQIIYKASINITTAAMLHDLEKSESPVRIMLFDFSSAYNTIQPAPPTGKHTSAYTFTPVYYGFLTTSLLGHHGSDCHVTLCQTLSQQTQVLLKGLYCHPSYLHSIQLTAGAIIPPVIYKSFQMILS